MDFRKDSAFIRLRQPTSQTCTIAARTNWIFYEELAQRSTFFFTKNRLHQKILDIGGVGGDNRMSVWRRERLIRVMIRVCWESPRPHPQPRVYLKKRENFYREEVQKISNMGKHLSYIQDK